MAAPHSAGLFGFLFSSQLRARRRHLKLPALFFSNPTKHHHRAWSDAFFSRRPCCEMVTLIGCCSFHAGELVYFCSPCCRQAKIVLIRLQPRQCCQVRHGQGWLEPPRPAGSTPGDVFGSRSGWTAAPQKSRRMRSAAAGWVPSRKPLGQSYESRPPPPPQQQQTAQSGRFACADTKVRTD